MPIRSSYQRPRSICRQRELQKGIALDESSSNDFPQVGQRTIMGSNVVQRGQRSARAMGYLRKDYFSALVDGFVSLVLVSVDLDSLLLPLASLLPPESLDFPSAAAFCL